MNGALIIDKPAGVTSHDVVAQVRRTIGERRIGHTGTLDPFATGVLVLLLGKATRLAQFLSSVDKEYEALIRLGYATDTGDLTGSRLVSDADAKAQSPQSLSREAIEKAFVSFQGEIDQLPPMYSAKKVGGRKLYELARRGEDIARKSIRVEIKQFELLKLPEFDGQPKHDGTRDLPVRIVCSAGTYVRTLAHDLGTKLGIGAHVAELRRTRVGDFVIRSALTLEQLADFAATNCLTERVISPHDTLAHLPAFELSAEQADRVLHGVDIQADKRPEWTDNQSIRLCQSDGRLVAVGNYNSEHSTLHPSVVIG
jgi:tRNA pseudouridine55 synthase